jgi:hypothetical protein
MQNDLFKTGIGKQIPDGFMGKKITNHFVRVR